MKILYLTSSIPSLDHEAVERVNYEILKSLLQKKYKIYVQIILQEGENFNYSQDNLKSIFKTNDIFFLEPLTNKIYFKKIFNYLKILLPNKIMMYPSIMHKSKLLKIINEKKIDLIFQSWDYPGLAACYKINNIKKILYYGQPDHKPTLMALADRDIYYNFKGSLLSKIKIKIIKRYNSIRENIHLDMVKNFDEVNIICKGAFTDYFNAGIRKAKYTQNMWPFTKNYNVISKKNYLCKIVGSVGSNNATGNTTNFFYIGKYLLKEIKRDKKFKFELNFYGKNFIRKNLEYFFKDEKNVNFKGWVNNLDNEVKKSDIFLICHNGMYKNKYVFSNGRKWHLGGTHTRFLYAWSIGCPIVTHKNNIEFIPEIKHGYNVLIGSSAKEISHYIKKLYNDCNLRNKLIFNGRKTLKKHFLPNVVVDKLVKQF